MNGGARSELGLPPSRQEFATLRARWADLTNEALRQANIEARIDHRSLEAQGVDREPRPQLPWAAVIAERKGEHSEVAERIRERHRERVCARAGKAAEKGIDTQAGKPVVDSAVIQPQPPPESALPLEMDARRRQAVQDWLNYRAGLEHGGQEQTGAGHGKETASPLSMDDIRRRAVEAWRSLQARGAESRPSSADGRDRDTERDRGKAGLPRNAPGLDDDFTG
jgi:hypothetical protein